MKADKSSLLFYAVTDRSWLNGRTLAQQTEEAIQGGATFIQLREKNLPFQQVVELARQIKKVTDFYHVPFVINDDIEAAAACGADGVHIGQDDDGIEKARRLLGPDKMIGVSVQTPAQALEAEEKGADYLGAGSVFPTLTKMDAEMTPVEVLREICRTVSIPVVAIGGINTANIHKLKDTGAAGAAMVSAVFAQPDIVSAARSLRILLEQTLAE